VGLSGKPMSTIAFERRWNLMLSRPTGIHRSAGRRPTTPADMEQILTFNCGHHEVNANA
jgi:hydroxyacylglutathione hydrolase